MSISFKGEVIADNSGKWYDNALRFATYDEAHAYITDLSWRWTAVRKTRVVESDEPVNYRLDEGRLIELESPKPTKPLLTIKVPGGTIEIG